MTVPYAETDPPAITDTTAPIEDHKLSEFEYSSDDKFEYENKNQPIKVKGSLKEHFHFWENIRSNQYILDVIKFGYRLPLITNPPPCHLKNNKSSLENSSFVIEAIDELLKTGSVIETFSKPFVINPLTVAKNKKKSRLVLDL